jgi:carboxymethylenebutenolidase
MAARTVMLGTMNVHLSEPAAAGPHPAMVVCFHRPGIDAFVRTVTARLAQNGYVAAAPNFYHRRPKGEDSAESRNYQLDADVVADIGTTLEALKKMPNVRAERIGIMGHCMGGRMALLGAVSFQDFRACADFWGGSVEQARGEGRPSPLSLVGNINGPVLGIFGNDDTNPSPADVDRIAATLKGYGKTFEFHRYDGAGHAFQNFKEKSYRKEASDDAWSKLIPFFQKTLKVKAPQAAK